MKHSYSSLSKFMTCPAQYKAQYIDKTIKFTQNPAAMYGSENHDVCDKALKTGVMPDDMKYQFIVPTLQSIINSSKGSKIESELAYGLDVEKKPTSFFDGWLRGKLDVRYEPSPNKVVIADHKFAAYDAKKYDFEMDVFSYLELMNKPETEKIKRAILWYKPYNKDFTPIEPTVTIISRKDHLSSIEDNVCGKIREVEDAIASDNFPEKKGGLCKAYCDVLTCRFNGKNK